MCLEVTVKRWAEIAATLLIVLATSGVEAQQVEHLDCPDAVARVCAVSAVRPPEPLKEGPSEHLRARLAGLMQVYSVDVNPRDFQIANFDAVTGQLALTLSASYPLFGGGYEVELVNAPLIVFEVSREVGEQLDMERSMGRVMLRLFFLLDGLSQPEVDTCAEVGALRIRAHLMRARLWRAAVAGDGGQRPPGPEDILGSFEVPAVGELAAALGLSLDAAPGPRPTVSAVLPGKLLGALGEAERAELAQEAELRLAPCFLAALGQGMQPRGTLTFELRVERGAVMSAAVNTDQAGFPPLGRCAERALVGLSLPPSAPARARLTVYFNGP